MTENQRLKIIREDLGFDQRDFATAFNMLQGSISDIERGRNKVSPKILKKLSAFGVNVQFILTGEGEYYSKPKEEVLNNMKKQDNQGVSEGAVDYNAKKALIPESGHENLFIIPIKAFGGFLAGYENKAYLDSLEKISFPFVRGKCFAFEIEGYSMISDDPKEDSYNPGSWVICTEIESASWCQKGKVYVFATVDGICIKQFQKVDEKHYHLQSLNPAQEYKVRPIPVKDVKRIFHVELKMAKPFY